jgi:CheY-like chemotaxis protein
MDPILLIEDNYELLENTAEMLELANYNVVKAENGRIALERMKEGDYRFSIVLSDIMMPELDGYGVLKAIANIPQMKDIPFVFTTAKSEKQDLKTGVDLGADGYLIKPFSTEELLQAVSSRVNKPDHKTTLFRKQ